MRNIVLFCLLIAISRSASAESPSTKTLPPPGSWVTYRISHPALTQYGAPSRLNRYLTIRLMEPALYQKVECRWVEYEVRNHTSIGISRKVDRYLVPVDSLLNSKTPYLDIKAALHGESLPITPLPTKPAELLARLKDVENIPPLVQIERPEITPGFFVSAERSGWKWAVFPGFRKEMEAADDHREFYVSNKTYECRQRLHGKHIYRLLTAPPDENHQPEVTSIEIKIYTQPEFPLGVAGIDFYGTKVGGAYRSESVRKIGYQPPRAPSLRWLIHDFGTDAKPPFEGRRPEPNQE